MDEREELERLRREQGDLPGYPASSQKTSEPKSFAPPTDERAYLEYLRKKQGSIKPSLGEQATAQAFGTLTKPLVAATEYVDRYLGAPYRAAYEKYQKGGGFGDVMDAYIQQYGQPTEKAPTTAKLYENLGVSGEQTVPFASVKGLGTPYARFEQTKISPSEIAGGVTGFALDPTNLIPMKPIKGAAYFGPKALETAADLGEWGVKKGSRGFLGTGEPQYEYYKANRARLEQPGRVRESIEDIRNEMLADANKFRSETENLIAGQERAESNLKEYGKKLQKDYDTRELIGPQQAEIVQEALEADKAVQGALSKLADDELAKMKIPWPRKEVKIAIDEEIKKYTPNTREKAAVIDYLQDLKTRLNENYTKYMSGPQLRDWIRDVRKSIESFKTGRNAGEYVDDLDKSLLSIQEYVSEKLKLQVPEYKKIVNEMSGRIEKSKLVQPKFRGIDESQGMRTLRRLMSNDPQDAALVKTQLTEWAKNNNHPQAIKMLDEIDQLNQVRLQLQQNNYNLRQAAEIGGKDTQIPLFQNIQQQVAELDNLEQLINEQKQALGEFYIVNQSQTENFIKNIGAQKPSLANLERIEAFERATNKPYKQRIQDELFEQAMEADRRQQSSARTNVAGFLGAAGGMLGSMDPTTALVSGGLSAGFGHLTDKFGGVFARKLWEKSVPATEGMRNLSAKIKSGNINPKLKTYLEKLDSAAARGAQGVVLYHHLLWNNDPEYRKAVME